MIQVVASERPIAQDPGKLKVFISYSRKDSSDFAEELVAGLDLAGFAPFLDRHDIAAGEDWEARLGGLIADADTVIFVVSPEAVKSERCSREVDKALALSKRIFPVIFRAVPDTEIPKHLRRLQFVRFDSGPGLTRPLAQLAAALRKISSGSGSTRGLGNSQHGGRHDVCRIHCCYAPTSSKQRKRGFCDARQTRRRSRTCNTPSSEPARMPKRRD